MHAMDDRELLREYAERRSETAFAELVRRHLDWVHAAALRQTGDAALAQDVAQSVFVLLSRKARAVAARSKVGGWLFQTTRFVAARARRSEVRRLHREPVREIRFAVFTRGLQSLELARGSVADGDHLESDDVHVARVARAEVVRDAETLAPFLPREVERGELFQRSILFVRRGLVDDEIIAA